MWHFFSFVMFFFSMLFSIFLLFAGFFRDCIHIFSSCQLAETLFIDRCEICVHSSKLFQQAFFLENCEVKLAICIESNKSSIHCLLNVMMQVFFLLLLLTLLCFIWWLLRLCAIRFTNEIEMNNPLLSKIAGKPSRQNQAPSAETIILSSKCITWL